MNTPVDTNPLTHLLETARAHWAQYCPRLVAELAAAGRLDAALEAAVTQTETAIEGLMTQHGYTLLEAWEAVREEWVLLPAEDDEEDADDLFWDADDWEDEDDEDDDDDWDADADDFWDDDAEDTPSPPRSPSDSPSPEAAR